ncbi:MAG: 50S ribosomal protein L25 [Candidatus Omnitrophica bacterium]|jgi:large subunit ribosomal protein L25|nr:50S ribosomal protein L25 [Candidatus Omnitrophota bacterium]
MERIKITVNHREERKKKELRQIREKGAVPAVVYSSDINMPIIVPLESMKALKMINFSESAVIDMELLGGKKTKPIPVFIKGVQFNPLTDEIIHLDFLKVSLTEKIKVYVPVILKGEPKEVLEAQGTVEQVLREVEIEGLPLDIPEKIELEISALTIGRSLHVSDLAVADNLKITTDIKATVVTALAKKEEVIEEVAAAGAESTEPEVIKEKKEGVEEEGKEEGEEEAEGSKEKAKEQKEKAPEQKKQQKQ